MKRISFYSIYTVLLCVLFTSCDVDNYDGPNAKFRGVVIDKTTGKGIQTEQPNGFKIKWTELSWEYQDNIQPEVKCYKALMGLDSPCPPCPVALGIQCEI